jgi:outer membrane protein assembly factor BamD
MKFIIIIRFVLIISLSFLLSSCVIFGDPTEVDETTGLTDYEVLQKAENIQNAKDWPRAIKIYEIAEKRFPNSKLAPQFKLNLAYAYKEFYQESEAIAMLDKFIRSYPNHPALDYAYYLKGVVLFRDRGFFKELTLQDISDRDVSQLEDSFKALKIMTQLFPKSEYFDDAKNRMTYLMNKIAEKELYVARYYMRRDAFIAALNRAKYVLENYPETVHQEEALIIKISAYKNLGINDLASDTQRVLQLNFPNSEFNKDRKTTKNKSDEKTWWKFWDILS